MKKLLFWIFGVLLLVGLGIASVPFFLDGESLKQKFIQRVELITGKKVFVGNFSIDLLPVPIVNIQGFKIFAADVASKKAILDVKSIQAEVDLKSLFTGNVEVVSAELVAPTLYVEFSKDGKTNWFNSLLKSAGKAELSGNKAYTGQSFGGIKIKGGTFVFSSSAPSFEYKLGGINGEMIADTLLGPFRFDGNFRFLNSLTSVAVSLDSLGKREGASFNVMLASPDPDVSLSFRGKLLSNMASVNLDGSLSFDIADVNAFVTKFSDEIFASSFAKDAFASSMSVLINDKALALDNIVMKYANSSAVGKGELLFSDDAKEKNIFKADLTIDTLNLKAFKDFLKAVYQSDWRSIPIKIDTSSNIKINYATYNNQNVNNITFALDTGENKISVRDLKATLPSNSELVSNLAWDTSSQTFDGKVNFISDDLSSVMKWLGLPSLNGEKGAFTVSSLAFDVKSSAKQLSFENLSFNSGKTSVSGKIALSLPDKKNWDLDLKAKNIYLKRALFPDKEKMFTVQNVPMDKRVSTNPKLVDDVWLRLKDKQDDFSSAFTFLSDIDLNLNLDVTDLFYEKEKFSKFLLKAKKNGGALNIEDFKLNASSGSFVNLKGTIFGLGSDLVAFDNLEYNLKLAEAEGLLDEFGIVVPFDLTRMGSVILNGVLGGDLQKLALKALGDISGTYVMVNAGIIAEGYANPSGRLKLEIRHPQFRNFIRLFSKDYDVPEPLSSNVKFVGTLDVNSSGFTVENIELDLATDKFTGSAFLTEETENKVLFANLQTQSIDLDKYLNIFSSSVSSRGKLLPVWSDVPFPSWIKSLNMGLRLEAADMSLFSLPFTDADLDMRVNNAEINIPAFKADISGGKMFINSSLNFAKATPLIQTYYSFEKIKLLNVFPYASKVNLSAEKFSLKGSFEGEGNSVKSLVSSLKGQAELSLENGDIIGFSLSDADAVVKDAFPKDLNVDVFREDLRSAFKQKDTSFSSIKGTLTYAEGVLKASDLLLTSSPLSANLDTSFNLLNGNLTLKVAVPKDTGLGLPPYSLLMEGTPFALSYSFDDEDLVKVFATDIKEKREKSEQLAKEKALKELEDKKERRRLFADTLAPLKKMVAGVYAKSRTISQLSASSDEMKEIEENNKKLVQNVAEIFAPVLKMAESDDVALDNFSIVSEAAEKISPIVKEMEEIYNQALIKTALERANNYLNEVKELDVFARGMEKKYPYLIPVAENSAKVSDALYFAKLAVSRLEKVKDVKELGEYVVQAKEAFEKASVAVQAIKKLDTK